MTELELTLFFMELPPGTFMVSDTDGVWRKIGPDDWRIHRGKSPRSRGNSTMAQLLWEVPQTWSVS